MKLFLMLDYDGTLTPIVNDPSRAVLSAPRRELLRRLARRPGVKLAIISGRKLSVVKRLAGIRNIIYVGNHGLEILAGGKHWAHPAAKKTVPLLKKVKAGLKSKLYYRGVLIEDKGLTLSVHYRSLAKPAISGFKRDLKLALKPWRRAIKLTSGKKVFEVRPPVDWDKGTAACRLIEDQKLREYFPVYIGDDKTDEDAFLVLRGKGMTIHVGKGRTAAKMRIKDVKGVYCYLRDLIKNES